MSFFLYIPKSAAASSGAETLHDHIDVEYLDAQQATTYSCVAHTKHCLGRAVLWHYDHGSVIQSEPARVDEDGLFLVVGSAMHLPRKSADPKVIWSALASDPKSDDIQGDFVSIGVNHRGDGCIFSSLMSFNRIFFSENENFWAFASEIKLLYNAIKSYRHHSLLKFYDYDFIADSMVNEWGDRKFADRTFIKGISRLASTSRLSFKEFCPDIVDLRFKSYDERWGELYLRDKSEFYDAAFELLGSAVSSALRSVRSEPIEILMSGGLDSRLNAGLISFFANGADSRVSSKSWGPKTHPDVHIGERCADVLGFPFRNEHGNGELFFPRSVEDYQACMRIAQGDWNSSAGCSAGRDEYSTTSC